MRERAEQLIRRLNTPYINRTLVIHGSDQLGNITHGPDRCKRRRTLARLNDHQGRQVMEYNAIAFDSTFIFGIVNRGLRAAFVRTSSRDRRAAEAADACGFSQHYACPNRRRQYDYIIYRPEHESSHSFPALGVALELSVHPNARVTAYGCLVSKHLGTGSNNRALAGAEPSNGIPESAECVPFGVPDVLWSADCSSAKFILHYLQIIQCIGRGLGEDVFVYVITGLMHITRASLGFELILPINQRRRILITGLQSSSAVVSISVTNFVMVACPPLRTTKTSMLAPYD
ncbi:hypothetical protein EVAR_2744_1 [Eumeta japonica]|uniref:Uncharacterized protein n=1 Tax=Eumeta variegata TaxID=151549 RepID=A0A4C1SZH4_EUMVA|nr:hypothetical protein EVAR_2744_1 [Eumeta japonica]